MSSAVPVFAGIALAVFAFWCARSLHADLSRVALAPLARAWPLGLAAVLCSLLNYALRIARWKWYLQRLGHPLTVGFATLTYLAGFSFTLSPGKVGEMARARYYTEVGIPLSDVAAAFFAERLMDLVAMIALSGLILRAMPQHGAAAWTATGALTVALALLVAVPWPRIAAAVQSAQWMPRTVARVARGIGATLVSARRLQKTDLILVGFVLALGAWGSEGLGLYALTGMTPSAEVGAAVGVGIYAVAVLVGALSFLPGGLGSTEAVMIALLSAQRIPVADAVLITMACRLVTLWLAVGLGWLAMGVLRHRRQGALSCR